MAAQAELTTTSVPSRCRTTSLCAHTYGQLESDGMSGTTHGVCSPSVAAVSLVVPCREQVALVVPVVHLRGHCQGGELCFCRGGCGDSWLWGGSEDGQRMVGAASWCVLTGVGTGVAVTAVRRLTSPRSIGVVCMILMAKERCWLAFPREVGRKGLGYLMTCYSQSTVSILWVI